MQVSSRTAKFVQTQERQKNQELTLWSTTFSRFVYAYLEIVILFHAGTCSWRAMPAALANHIEGTEES